MRAFRNLLRTITSRYENLPWFTPADIARRVALTLDGTEFDQGYRFAYPDSVIGHGYGEEHTVEIMFGARLFRLTVEEVVTPLTRERFNDIAYDVAETFYDVSQEFFNQLCREIEISDEMIAETLVKIDTMYDEVAQDAWIPPAR